MIPTNLVVSRGSARARRGLGIAVLALVFASFITSTHPAAGAQTAGAPASPPYVFEDLTTSHQVQTEGSGRRRIRAKVKVVDQAGVTEWSTLCVPRMPRLPGERKD